MSSIPASPGSEIVVSYDSIATVTERAVLTPDLRRYSISACAGWYRRPYQVCWSVYITNPSNCLFLSIAYDIGSEQSVPPPVFGNAFIASSSRCRDERLDEYTAVSKPITSTS